MEAGRCRKEEPGRLQIKYPAGLFYVLSYGLRYKLITYHLTETVFCGSVLPDGMIFHVVKVNLHKEQDKLYLALKA